MFFKRRTLVKPIDASSNANRDHKQLKHAMNATSETDNNWRSTPHRTNAGLPIRYSKNPFRIIEKTEDHTTQ